MWLVKLTRADFCLLNWDGHLVHIEFQKGNPNNENSRRVMEYNHNYHLMIKNISLAFFTDIDEPMTVEYEYGGGSVFKYYALTFKSIDGEKQLNNIRTKIKNNEELIASEIVALKMIVYTNVSRPLHKAVCKLTKDLNIPQKQKKMLSKSIKKLTCQKVIDEKYHKKSKR